MPLSIIMPTYNGTRYLQQAIDSVLSQEHQDWELLISDDASTDGTREFLATIRDPRVKIHFQPKNLNIFGNLNFLLAQSNGEITQILCQDDYFVDSGATKRLLANWAQLPPEIAFLRANHTADANSALTRFEKSALPPIIRPERSDLLFFIFGCLAGNLSNVSFRTEAIKTFGEFRTDLPYAGDFEFWSRLGHHASWAITRTRTTHIRSHSGQASRNLNPRGELLSQMRVILDSLYRNLTAQGYSPSALRLLSTISYVSQHRDIGLKATLKGQGSDYLRRVAKDFDSSDFAFGPVLGWTIFFGTLGGRLFRIPAARNLLQQESARA